VDFATGRPASPGDPAGRPAAPALHVTLPGLKAAGVRAQVFASWVWSGKYKGRESEVGMAKVGAVRDLCAEYPGDLSLALTGADLEAAFAPRARIAVLPSLESADPLEGEVDNLFRFYEAGIRLLTLAWGDNPFCGSAYGDGSGLTKKGADLVAACEALGVMVDVSHLSDKGFRDVCAVASRPFVASHSNCRALCPSPRNLTDEMIRDIAERGGVVGITVAPGFLSPDYYEKERTVMSRSFHAVTSGGEAFDDAQREGILAMARVPRPPLALIVDHIKHAIDVGGEDSVGLGGDLDGVDYLPLGLEGIGDYPRIEESLVHAGLASRQIDKVCYGNMLRVFGEVLGA
jgi:membrane dipeptidase